MARPSNKAQRRSEIARGLMKVMSEKGYDGASISEVAAAAGLTQGLVHYHFKNKEEILIESLNELLSEQLQRLDELLEDGATDAWSRVAALIDFHLKLGKNADPTILASWLVISGEAMRRKDVSVAFEGAIAEYTQRLFVEIKKGVNEGQFSCSDSERAAVAIVAAIQGYFVLSATTQKLVARGSAAEAVKTMVKGLLDVDEGREVVT